MQQVLMEVTLYFLQLPVLAVVEVELVLVDLHYRQEMVDLVVGAGQAGASGNEGSGTT
jgi:hypothetical protein